jgi:hypothetical protein
LSQSSERASPGTQRQRTAMRNLQKPKSRN